jgi:UDP-N-acetylmuramoylalanine--D-glutamate ligase
MQMIASDRHTYVIGLGATGMSCARFLNGIGRSFSIWDTRENPPNLLAFQEEFPRVEILLGELDGARLSAASEIILSPGIAKSHPALVEAKSNGVKLRGDIDLFAEHADAPIAAITGSNGKTTVTTLLGEFAENCGLRVAIGGNIGTPALDLLGQGAALYVLELSSFQLELVERLSAKCVTLLNISEDHMDRYESKLAYLQAKQRIFIGAECVVVNDDEPLSQPLVHEGMKILHYGLNSMDLNKFSLNGDRYGLQLMRGFDALIDVNELCLSGSHNYSNALAALTMGSSLGLPMTKMLEVLRTFRGLRHRCEWVRDLNQVTYINDSKGTNTGAAVAAINGFAAELAPGAKIVWIAGGDAKDADMSPMVKPVAESVREAVLFGRDAGQIEEALQGAVVAHRVENLASAVKKAKKIAKPGDVVLFSPACASFDMFHSFEQRGDAFVTEVMAL